MNNKEHENAGGQARQVWGDIVLLERGSYAILQINREAKRNAMNRSARQNMMLALDYIKNRFPVVILTGAGSSFCAGVDLKERAEDLDRGILTASAEWVNVNVAIREHPSIFIAAVNGLALGGGATLINVCDLAVAADTVEIGMPEMGFATYPGMAGPSTQLSLSRKRAAWLVLTTERISADVAMQWGLINKCVPFAELMDCATAIARRVSQYNPNALAVAKQALDVIPASITGWRQAFDYAGLANAAIRQRNGNEDPMKNALSAKRGSSDAAK
jgi:enoyl-CoA hydratase/carnithine racemase